MNTRLLPFAAIAILALAGVAQASIPSSGQKSRAIDPYSRLINGAAGTRAVTPAGKSVLPQTAAGPRGNAPIHAVSGVAAGQAGYIHYFLLRMPDDSLEIQVGMELADQRIAWSFPGTGVTVSPFIDGDVMVSAGNRYDVWHLYGIRPHADAAAMNKLQKALPARVARWIKAGKPYCLEDSREAACISCLGFVLRALYPGRGDYPELPAGFWRAGMGSRYTPNDLLLYLTGLLDQPDRNARLQRISSLDLPPDLRLDLEKLVYAMGAHEAAPREALQRRSSTPRAPRDRL